MLQIKGLKTGNLLLSIAVVPRFVYSEPSMSEEVAAKRDRFEKWVKQLVQRFEQPITEAVERHMQKVAARKAGTSDSR